MKIAKLFSSHYSLNTIEGNSNQLTSNGSKQTPFTGASLEDKLPINYLANKTQLSPIQI